MALPPAIRRPLVAWGVLPALDVAPVREASPEEVGAAPTPGMVSRSGDSTWIPSGWEKHISSNDDDILRRDGGAGLKLYDALLDDDVAFSTLQQRRLAIIEKDWEVSPGDENDPRSVKAADDLRAMLKSVGWDRVTGLMHYALWYGYGVGEAIYTTKRHDGRLIVWLDDIVVPDRQWFGFSGEGQLKMIGTLASSIEGQAVPPNKFWTVRTGATHDFAFYGLGLAHWAYWPIFFKRAAIRFWALYLEKFGAPTVAIEFPPEEKDDQVKKDARLQAAVAIGQDRAVLLPAGTLEKGLKVMEATRSGSGVSSYMDFLNEMNEALMRIILGQPGTSKATPGGLGGDGQAKKDEGVKREIVKSDSDLLSESFNRTIARWLTIWNHGEDVAPPQVYRRLDDEESLTEIADRDVKLDGIGIKRSEKSVAETYGQGYELDRVSEEEKAKQALAISTAKAVPAPGQPPANDNQARNKARAAEFAAAFDIDGKAPLYVGRKLASSTAKKVHAWAVAAGIPNVPPVADLHTTLLYSKTPVDWFAMGDYWGGQLDGTLNVHKGGPRAVVMFDGGAIVLRFASPEMTYRHESMIERGASSDYPDFNPHITVGKVEEGEAFDPAQVDPYVDELEFEPEIFEPIEVAKLDPAQFDFAAGEEDAIDRLVAALVEDSNPVFAAMGDVLRDNLQGVTSLEGARVAILQAMEQMPVARLAQLTALPMLATRAAARAGREDAIIA